MTLLAIFLAALFFYSLFSQHLERTVLTAPLLFATAGAIFLFFVPALRDRHTSMEVFRRVAEIGLVLLLFTDACRTDLRVLRNIRNLPTRLLSVGMLLTIALGMLAALLVFPHLSLWEAGILAAILAPTDAGLGQIIVTSPQVPTRIRQALNVEAGLNDGLSVPFLLFFIALAGAGGSAGSPGLSHFIAQQLGLGTLIGIGIGIAGGFSLHLARQKKWMAGPFEQLAVVVLPLLCMLASEASGASMFIAAFVAGLAVQIGFKEARTHSLEFGEEWGQLLNLSVFFLFGLLVARNWQQFSLPFFIYALLSLTVVRMFPVAMALIGTGLSRWTTLFMGWFGPRGLASIVLGLVYLEQELHHPGESTIRIAVMLTVLISIFAHGLSARPGIKFYAARVATIDANAPERQEPGSGTQSQDLGTLAATHQQP
jgi:NhaP-type Na+/H+ or K+/H+ antiporter